MSEKVSKTDLNNNDSSVEAQKNDDVSNETAKTDVKSEPQSASVNKLAIDLDKKLAISKTSATTTTPADSNNSNANSTKTPVVADTAETNNVESQLNSSNESSPSENQIPGIEDYEDDVEGQDADELMQQMTSGNTTNDPG